MSTQPDMPWVAAWRYAKGRAFSPRTQTYWVGSVVGITVIELVATDWSLGRAVVSAVGFVFAMEAVEFARRFLSGPPVGEAGKNDV
jgi:hypothetical protein